jgi:uncharacterized membrane protein
MRALVFIFATTLSAQVTLECRGEEPFWGLKASGATATFTQPGTEQKFQGKLQEFGFLKPPGMVWRGASDSEQVLVVTIREESCASTMADGPPLTHRAMLSLPGRAMTGCCKVITKPKANPGSRGANP